MLRLLSCRGTPSCALTFLGKGGDPRMETRGVPFSHLTRLLTCLLFVGGNAAPVSSPKEPGAWGAVQCGPYLTTVLLRTGFRAAAKERHLEL